MGGQLRRPLTRARVTGVGVSLGGGLCLLWLSLSRSVETRKLNLCSLKSHVPCIPDVVERDLSFISSILSSPEGSGPVFYGHQRVFFEKNAGSVARFFELLETSETTGRPGPPYWRPVVSEVSKSSKKRDIKTLQNALQRFPTP